MKHLQPESYTDTSILVSWQCLVGQYESVLALVTALETNGQMVSKQENTGENKTYYMIGADEDNPTFSIDKTNKKAYLAVYYITTSLTGDLDD